MSEQTFRSPGFFEREIDLSQRSEEISGVPAGVIGTSETGPAFIPVTVGSFADFRARFGDLDSTKFGPYAANEFLKNRTALTFIRVLGAGSNETSTDIANTTNMGTVKNAGFKIIGAQTNASIGAGRSGFYEGAVQFIAARHIIDKNEDVGFPVFSDNVSYGLSRTDRGDEAFLVRGMVFMSTASKLQILSYDANYSPATESDLATAGPGSLGEASPLYKKFKLVISSSAGTSFGSDEGYAGLKILTASLDPSDDAYISKVLNTDPERFQIEQHLLYGDFAVEDEIATISTGSGDIGLLSGSNSTSPSSGDTSLAYRDMFGRFDTRYRGAKTTPFISQPYGEKEWDLFHFETIADGAAISDKYKVSISDIRMSSDPKNPVGSFSVLVRAFDDTDTAPQVLEQYGNCTLDKNDDDFVAKKIGDLSVKFNFDAEDPDERRFVVRGSYPNVSNRVRIVMSNDFLNGNVPRDALPFGFRGLPVPKTNNLLCDVTISKSTTPAASGVPQYLLDVVGGSDTVRMAFVSGSWHQTANEPDDDSQPQLKLSGSIVPPVPHRFKVTRGNTSVSRRTDAARTAAGYPGTNERADNRYYWGIMTARLPRTGTLADAILNPNVGSEPNPLVRSYTKFLGIEKLDSMVTGSGADRFNDNKFSLSKVALGNRLDGRTLVKTLEANITGSADEHMLDAAYIRDGRPIPGDYTVHDHVGGATRRVTLGSLVSLTSSVYFNRFSNYNKFTNIFYGGFDGNNILDVDMSRMNDRAASTDTGGKAGRTNPAASSDLDIGLTSTYNVGTGKFNNAIFSYRSAIDIITDPMVTRINILSVPGIRDTFVTDHAADKTRDYSQAMYLMDLPLYNSDEVRMFDNDGLRASVEKTVEKLESRAVDNNYVATYFPDVSMIDDSTGNPVRMPSSIAALSALGFNDAVSYPWFAPAGFNRAALSNVVNTSCRLNSADRDDLYDARINPIATFPNAGFVIFGQKTLQQAKSALDRVNVRRMLLEVKRLVSEIARSIVFEQNTPTTRAKFVSQVTPQLALIQSQQGIDQFRVVMDESNNTTEDIESNRLNGKIILVPTRAVEFISIDFIITNSGVSFE